ncbi:MAG: ABC transporter permease subunit [Microbacteriaceae bacterium]|nr:ABC transporter permease subunit [Microbacteriaceae bacterium]
MLDLTELGAWFSDPENWAGRYGLWNLVAEHLTLTFVAIVVAAIVAVPLGVAIGHLGRGEFFVVGLGSASRAIPTMGLLFALVLVMGVQFRELSVVLALSAIALPPLVAGAYSGVTTIPPWIRDSATAQGMTAWQLVRHVELPLAAASIIGGFRIAYIQVVSTVVLAPLVGLGGVGFGIIQGLALRNFSQVTASSIVIIVITVAGDRLIGLSQKFLSDRLGKPKPLETS